jgi:hypothetical protein
MSGVTEEKKRLKSEKALKDASAWNNLIAEILTHGLRSRKFIRRSTPRRTVRRY